MPRQPKRKAGEVDYDDPVAFVKEYCRKRSISYQIGQSHAEKECNRLADEARESFKSLRDAAGADGSGDNQPGGSSDADRKGLSPAQKYMIRLQNNRKSASASKVYNEVLKREQAACLEKLSTLQTAKEVKKCTRCRDLPSQETVASLQAQVAQLQKKLREERADHEQLQKQLREERADHEQLQKQLREERTDHEQLQKQLREERADHEKTRKAAVIAREPATHHVDMHAPTRQCSQETPNQANSSSSSLEDTPSPQRFALRPRGSATKSEQIIDVYRQPPDAPHISTGTIDESQQEHVPPLSSQENLTLSHKRKHSHPYSMSLSQSDMKEMQAGVNLSQSQTEHPEELDEKGQLMRNMPRAEGIPVAMLDSQPSQSDGAACKYTIGSDELNFSAPDCAVGSQGTVDGGTPKKARLQ